MNNSTNRDVRAHTAPGKEHNLHDQAWDIADLEVFIMRERPGSAKQTELLARRESMLARFELQNHGAPNELGRACRRRGPAPGR